MATVKPTRGYDSTRRRRQARENRDAVLGAARELFLAQGYAATKISAIAERAGVSVETVYKAFGNKPGLVQAIADAALAAPTQRSDAMSAQETDPHTVVRRWAGFACEVLPRLAPVVLLIRAAAASSPEMAGLLARLDADRRERMDHQARLLHDRGQLRPDVDIAQAGDVMWAYTDPGLYELLVLRQSWPLDRFRGFLATALAAALLPPD
ncbi:helix-turn-helix domain-containing protein [Actinocrispum sp. NPDC049592]|uniref:TetR/AcrR family transcriptional regulator n=1 Tax=Actinocrispum sp. NPDC049592 TaxID=3154835 RepID=UPI00342CBF66